MCLCKTDINQFFNSRAICKYNGVHVNESTRYALRFIYYPLISLSETASGESAASALERWVSHNTFNEDDWVLSVCGLLSVSFAAVCASACWRDTQRLIRGDACCISAVVSDYNRSNISICAFNNQMRLHSSSFVWTQTSSWSGLSDQIYIRLESVYTWSFQDRITIPSQKTHVTRCK